jgi:hypothetical protein
VKDRDRSYAQRSLRCRKRGSRGAAIRCAARRKRRLPTRGATESDLGHGQSSRPSRIAPGRQPVLQQGQREFGAGDVVHGVTHRLGIKHCGTCAKRKAVLNAKKIWRAP